MFNNTVIQLKWLTEHCEPPVKLNISWCLRSSRCFHKVFGLHPLKAGSYFRTTTVKQEGCSGFYVFYQYPAIECKQHMTHSEASMSSPWTSSMSTSGTSDSEASSSLSLSNLVEDGLLSGSSKNLALIQAKGARHELQFPLLGTTVKWAGQYGFLLLHLQAEFEHQIGWHCLPQSVQCLVSSFRLLTTLSQNTSSRRILLMGLSISADCDMGILWRDTFPSRRLSNMMTTPPQWVLLGSFNPVTVKDKEMRKRSAEDPKETFSVKAEAAVATGKAPAPAAKKQVTPQHHFDAMAQTWEDGLTCSSSHIKEKSSAATDSVPPQNWDIQHNEWKSVGTGTL